jgi:hypothetical protein
MRAAIAVFVTLTALNASGSVFVGTTFGSTKGGTEVYIDATETIGCYGTCTLPQVLFDGIASPSVRAVTPTKISAIAPPHPVEGIVPVVVITPTKRITAENKFAYVVDRDSVLIPLFFDSMPGYGGAQWSTELWVHNDTDSEVAITDTICGSLFGPMPCGTPQTVPARSSSRIPPPPSYYSSLGQFYSIPRDIEDRITFDLRLRDLAHPAAGSTSIPIVHGYPVRDKIVLLNVPADPSLRKLVRLYGGEGTTALIEVYDLETGAPLANETIRFSHPDLPTDGGGSPFAAFASATSAVFDVPAVRNATRLRLEIVPLYGPLFFWAMVSVTDSAQHVTIIAPAP